jgi:transcriptional regulator with XRE-family HTH domain
MSAEPAPGNRLRAVREAQRRGLRATARLVPMDPSRLSKIERGLERPTVDELVGLGKILGLRDLVETIGLFYQPRDKRGGGM